jgi:glycosyltransferase involved in cell wall biosynthesis
VSVVAVSGEGTKPDAGRAIRIALLVDSPSQRAHGNSVSRLALGLLESGRAETTLVCYSDDPRPPWLPPDIAIHRLGVDRVSRSLRPLVRYLRSEQPDVLITRQVHANFVGLAASSMARVPPGWPGKLVIVQDHPIELSHASNWRDNKWAAKAGYRFADGYMCPSPVVRQDIIRWCGLEPSSTVVVPNPIPKFAGSLPAPPHRWLKDGEPPVFINTSNMTPWKRLDLLLEAFKSLRDDQDVRLLIIGDGPERAHADQLISRLQLNAAVETVGWVEDPLHYAARAWAFVLASDEEGFAQVLTEAMSVACPVVTTDAQGGGPRFVTDNGAYGLLVPTGDAASLSKAMAHMLRPDVRARYSELGRTRADAFSPLASATTLLDFVSKRFRLAG